MALFRVDIRAYVESLPVTKRGGDYLIKGIDSGNCRFVAVCWYSSDSDGTIVLAAEKAQQKCPFPLRRIVAIDPVSGKSITLLTNHFEFAASTIGAIYKDRWQIELFFKALKQNLKVKTFSGYH